MKRYEIYNICENDVKNSCKSIFQSNNLFNMHERQDNETFFDFVYNNIKKQIEKGNRFICFTFNFDKNSEDIKIITDTINDAFEKYRKEINNPLFDDFEIERIYDNFDTPFYTNPACKLEFICYLEKYSSGSFLLYNQGGLYFNSFLSHSNFSEINQTKTFIHKKPNTVLNKKYVFDDLRICDAKGKMCEHVFRFDDETLIIAKNPSINIDYEKVVITYSNCDIIYINESKHETVYGDLEIVFEFKDYKNLPIEQYINKYHKMIEYSYNNGNLLDKSNKTCQFYDINEKELSLTYKSCSFYNYINKDMTQKQENIMKNTLEKFDKYINDFSSLYTLRVF